MKLFLLFFKIAAIVFTTTTAAQSIIKCNDKITYWVIPDRNCNYTIKLKGDIDLSNQRDILNVDDKALQYTLLDKNRYTDANSENRDAAILSKYTAIESDYLQDKFNGEIEIFMEMKTLSTGKTVILWYFNLPKGKNKEVSAQLFADIVIGDRIFGLGTPLFTGQDFNTVRSFLLEAITTITKVKNTNALCNK